MADSLTAKTLAVLGLFLVVIAYIPTFVAPLAVVLGVDLTVFSIILIAIGALLAMLGVVVDSSATAITFATGLLVALHAAMVDKGLDSFVVWTLATLVLATGYASKH